MVILSEPSSAHLRKSNIHPFVPGTEARPDEAPEKVQLMLKITMKSNPEAASVGSILAYRQASFQLIHRAFIST